VRILPLLVVSLSVGMLLLLIQRRYATEQALRKTVTTLREHVEALAQAQQASRAAAWTYDVASGRTRWYEGGEEVFGRPHAEVAARASVVELIAPEDQDRVRDLIRHTHETGEPFAVEFRVVWPNGELHWLESRGTPLRGQPPVWRGTTIDVTGRKLAQDALIRTEKLAIAGRLAASIAHEINNPLEAVTNLCYLGRMSAKDPEAERYIAMAEEELRRVAQITSQTLRFHRQQSAATETDLGELVETTVAMYRTKLQECGVRTTVQVRATAPLRCYAGEIRQVLANLIGNAIDAMPAGGLLHLRVRPCLLSPEGAPGVRITVADTGPACRLPSSGTSTTRSIRPRWRSAQGSGSGSPIPWWKSTRAGFLCVAPRVRTVTARSLRWSCRTWRPQRLQIAAQVCRLQAACRNLWRGSDRLRRR
jgi:PAS domain S-box-containing protein